VPRRDRDEHLLEPLTRLAYPQRLLFFDSESYVKKPDTDDLAYEYSSTPIGEPHRPRLICSEFVTRKDDATWAMDGGAYNAPEKRSFREADFPDPTALCHAFWKYASDVAMATAGHGRGRTRTFIFAHNIGYDMLATGAYGHLPSLPEGAGEKWKVEHVYSKGPVFITRATCGRHTLEILSTTNFFIAPLKQVAKDFGTEKLDFPTELFSKPVLTPEETVAQEVYCQRDTEIIRIAVIKLIQLLETGSMEVVPDPKPVGPWKATISSIAFSAFRYRFMEHQIVIHVDPDAIRLERAAYCGGRTEVFFKGVLDGETHDFDVNNLYGWVMQTFYVPRKLLEVRHNIGVKELAEMIDRREPVIAQVRVKIEERALPYKAEKLLFPVGEFVTTLCTPELQLAIELGEILSVGEVAVYEAAPVFKSYVQFMTTKRNAAKLAHHDAESTLYKALNNHVYGKVGQMSEEWTRVGDCPPDQPFRQERIVETKELPDGTRQVVGTRVIAYMPSGVYEWNGLREEAFNAFPAIAAFITSYARVRLWQLRCIAEGKDGRHVFYCDTDSIFVDHVGRMRLEAAGEVDEYTLGKVKHEWEAEVLKIDGAKCYEYLERHEQHQPGKDKKERCKTGWRLSAAGEMEPTGGSTTDPHLGHEQRFKGIPERGLQHIVIMPDGTRRAAYEQFPGLGGHLLRRDVTHFKNQRVLKKLEVDYTKGIVPMGPRGVPEGFVAPLRFPLKDAPAVVAAWELGA
jgi:hypothetical protein